MEFSIPDRKVEDERISIYVCGLKVSMPNVTVLSNTFAISFAQNFFIH